ncbi:uncharacterized protein [Panulirus ornatus]|uniref:uncharacterized protein isoform X2 n=1 Tax=Panulirus ornatus TaxID=150431 RepID=UPI003A83DAA4
MAFPDVMITSNRILAGFPNGIGGVCCGRHTFMVWFLSMVFFPVTGISGPAGYPVNKERAKNPICQKTALIVCFSCADTYCISSKFQDGLSGCHDHQQPHTCWLPKWPAGYPVNKERAKKNPHLSENSTDCLLLMCRVGFVFLCDVYHSTN